MLMEHTIVDETVLVSAGGAADYASHDPTMVARHRSCVKPVLGVSLHLRKLHLRSIVFATHPIACSQPTGSY